MQQKQPLPYAAPAPQHIPDYSGLRFGASALRICGFLAILGALVGFASMMFDSTKRPEDLTAALILGFAYNFGLACTFIAAASACEAFRDMARNSFK